MNCTNYSIIDDSENSVVAKLRRLKIEENMLVNNINKINPKETFEDGIVLPVMYSLELKKYTTKLKNSFTEIKNMFGDIKASTDENISSLDIGNIKRDVIKLDDKLRIFKQYLQSELINATTQEEELTKQLNDNEEKGSKCMVKSKTKIKPFNHIVPSPVKVMIQSPFKCQEVQQFQEFMKSSPNRYGGWNEYHHNLFVQIWHKYFNSLELQIEFVNDREFTVGNHVQFEAFLKEILQKCSVFKYNDIVSHHNWYCKYLFLKQQQQTALDKWKINKKRLTSTGTQYKRKALVEHNSNVLVHKPKPSNSNGSKLLTNNESEKGLLDAIETLNVEEITNVYCNKSDTTLQGDGLSLDTQINMIVEDNHPSGDDGIKQKQRSFSDVLRPTKQWINRCKSSRDSVKGYNDLETIKKLRVPDWRLTLQN